MLTVIAVPSVWERDARQHMGTGIGVGRRGFAYAEAQAPMHSCLSVVAVWPADEVAIEGHHSLVVAVWPADRPPLEGNHSPRPVSRVALVKVKARPDMPSTQLANVPCLTHWPDTTGLTPVGRLRPWFARPQRTGLNERVKCVKVAQQLHPETQQTKGM